MKTNKKSLINFELLTAIQKYKESLRLSKKSPDDKILKIQVSYSKYIIKLLILKEFIKNGN